MTLRSTNDDFWLIYKTDQAAELRRLEGLQLWLMASMCDVSTEALAPPAQDDAGTTKDAHAGGADDDAAARKPTSGPTTEPSDLLRWRRVLPPGTPAVSGEGPLGGHPKRKVPTEVHPMALPAEM
eukprot:CAMPEP_0197426868 /NCGR_PEP_ID=MMETSP1170-20131217/36511_1 /TAXON_ID=54406 /ORGANISM="Sarcinochrysis sp, Strain CCMP770" /LENGTH=124 /DNA_ID=CAMNT_0042954535 /DNA_START=11 /DNA_END=386 /DNA_ORIENTATION=-